MAVPRGLLLNDASAHLLKQHLDLLTHYNALVTSNQKEMLAMCDLLDRTRIEWLKSVQETDRLKAANECAESENRRLQAKVDALKNQLNSSQSQMTTVLSTVRSREAEIEENWRRFRQIKATLQENRENLASTSALSELSALVESVAERVAPPKPHETRRESKSPRAGCPLSAKRTSASTTVFVFKRDSETCSALLDTDFDSTQAPSSRQSLFSSRASIRLSGASVFRRHSRSTTPESDVGASDVEPPSSRWVTMRTVRLTPEPPANASNSTRLSVTLPTAVVAPLPATTSVDQRDPMMRSSLLTSDAEAARVRNSQPSQCSTQGSARTSNESGPDREKPASSSSAAEAEDPSSPSLTAMERTLLADAQRSPLGSIENRQSDPVLAGASEPPEVPTSAANQDLEKRSSLLTSDAESVRVLDSRQSQCSTQASARTSNESASTRYATADEADVEEATPSRSAMEHTLLADAQPSPSGANDAGPYVDLVAPIVLEALETLTIHDKQCREPRSSLLTSDAESVRVLDSQQSQYSTQPNSQSSSDSGPAHYGTPASEGAVGDDAEEEEPKPSPAVLASLSDVPGPSTSTPIRRTPMEKLSVNSFNSTPRTASTCRNLQPLFDDPLTPLTPVSAEKAAQLRTKVSRFDVATLRSRLREYNVDVGPINAINRSLYEKKLVAIEVSEEKERVTDRYSSSLERMIRYEEQDVRSNIGDKEERQLRLEFAISSPKNNEVSFFCYLLIDPTLLPEGSQCTFRRFVAAIFYVGKGNRSRPLQHLKDASKCRASVDKGLIQPSEKLRQIISLWNAGHGVISLHVCFNIHSAEAYIREGAMIESIGVANLTNVKHGEFRECARNWSRRQITDFGALCLKKAYAVFQNERCRPIFEADLN